MSKGHIHADLMAQYAEDAANSPMPWLKWQIYIDQTKSWTTLNGNPSWSTASKYRRTPEYREVFGIKIEYPLQCAPPVGTWCFRPDLKSATKVNSFQWDGSSQGWEDLKNGVLYTTPEEAVKHAQAVIKFMEVMSTCTKFP